jgi:hypothetical protein
MEMIRKVLAPFSIFPPQTNFLDGDSGHEVFPISQFGNKMGMTNDGTVVVKNYDPYYIYFEYQMNDMGSFDIFCEIVEESELQEILDDIESEMEDGETTDGDEADAEDSFDSYKADNGLNEELPGVMRRSNKTLDPDLQKNFKDYKSDQEAKRSSNDIKTSWSMSSNPTYKMMGRMKPWQDTDSRAKYDATRDKVVDKQNQREIRREPPITVKEETLNELRGKSSLSNIERKKLKQRILDKHGKAWIETQNIRRTKKSFGPSKDTKDVDSFRNRLGGIYNKLEKEKVDESNLALALGTLAGIAPAIYGMRSGLIQKGVRKASNMTSNLKNKIRAVISNKKAKTEKK